MYEVKNRTKNDLGVLEIAIEHRDGILITNPNGLAVSAILALGNADIDVPEGFTGVFNPLELRPLVDVGSLLSGEPAVLYKTDELTIPLTVEELSRFIGHALLKDEYLKLRDHFGMFYEIHEDFYDPDTTEPLQSRAT